MKEKIKVQFNSEVFGLEEYETNSIFKITAWLIAVKKGYKNNLSKEIAELCHRLWLSVDFNEVGEFAIVDYITENYNDLEDDFHKIREEFLDHYIWSV